MGMLTYAAIPLQYLGISTSTRNAVVERPEEYIVLPHVNSTPIVPIVQLTYKENILAEIERLGGIWIHTKGHFAQYRTVQMDKRFVDPETHRLYPHLADSIHGDEQEFRRYYRRLIGIDTDWRTDVHDEKRLIKDALKYHSLSRLGFKHDMRIEGDKALYIDFPHVAISATKQQLAKSTGLEALLQEPAPGVRIQDRDLVNRLVDHIELYNRHGVQVDRVDIMELPLWKRTVYAPKGGYLKVVPVRQDEVLQYHTNGTAELQKGAGSLYSEFLVFSHQYQGNPVKDPSPVAAVLKDFSDAASKVPSRVAAFLNLGPLPTQKEIASRLIEKNMISRNYTAANISPAETYSHVNAISPVENISQAEPVSRAGAAS